MDAVPSDGDGAVLKRWFGVHCRDTSDEQQVRSALQKLLSADSFSVETLQLSKEALWSVFVSHVKRVSAFTAGTFVGLTAQLADALNVFLVASADALQSPRDATRLLSEAAHVLTGHRLTDEEIELVLPKLFGLPVLFSVRNPPQDLTSISSFCQCALILIALRAPTLVLVRDAPTAQTSSSGSSSSSSSSATSPAGGSSGLMEARRKAHQLRVEEEKAGDNPALLRELVEQKQRQVDVLTTRLQRLDTAFKVRMILWFCQIILFIDLSFLSFSRKKSSGLRNNCVMLSVRLVQSRLFNNFSWNWERLAN